MIQKVHAYQTTDEQTWPNIELAQERQLLILTGNNVSDPPTQVIAVIQSLIKHRDKVMDILTMKKSSRPKARKINRSKETISHDNKAA